MALKQLLFILAAMLPTASWGCVADAPNGNSNQVDADHTLKDGQVEPDAQQNTNNNTNNWQPPTNSRVYVNTKDKLYYIDPGDSTDLVEVGSFTGPCTQDSGFYDIALNQDKKMIAISAEGLYWVDTDTAACTIAYQFPANSPHFHALSYVKGVDVNHPDEDKLIGASDEDGEWVMIDFPNENPGDLFVHLGYYEPHSFKWVSSGDNVSFQTGAHTFKTYATLRCENYDTDPSNECYSDWLAEITPQDGYAKLIGQTGYRAIYGLGFWGDRLYGFTSKGKYLQIDIHTGKGMVLHDFGADMSFWGAGNTTKPYIIQ
ncbi:MAG: hypothetical protein J7M25_10060 [Deltaproteobacteria bacterium]|nr:hypothetical protein [Deltaproteobacteria bacterium]